ncbi:MAG TPA: D-alanine--D-alanine ligase [Candidatus Baltobacteraceae bacterium]|nr:D-alanine--D-alanine ligase [Candidatus Baltobacteraceae bacterium]
MKKRKIRVGIIFGGRSSEHEVSLLSARSIVDAIDRKKYDVALIGVGKDGRWLGAGAQTYLLHKSDPKRIAINVKATTELALKPGSGGVGPVDVVFPVMHGTYGEDGSIQGLLRMLDVPFVGPDILGSAVGMDKDVAKRLLRDAGIPVADFLTFSRGEAVKPTAVWKRLGKTVFVKPANQGSSVGVSKATDVASLKKAVREAFKYDTKILIEEAVPGREIEVSVLGNEKPEASVPGEVIPHHEFYSYEAKYLDDDGAGLAIPAKLSAALTRKVQALAVKTFKTLALEGMARVDFFMKKDGTFVVNEVNTIPGFTKISMYPKLWAASGLAYPKLIDRLITLALERHARRGRLATERAA